MMYVLIFSLWFFTNAGVSSKPHGKPHIIIILADDLGWNDVSFHGSNEIPTPNIDSLAYNGIILNSHYALPLCTPSRAALLTGKYPIHNGMQQNLILAPEPWGLPLTEKLLPQYLKELGYATHAIGKWHLGFFKREYTPIFRGFDHHFGFWNGQQNYYTRNSQATFAPFEGYDLRHNLNVYWDRIGTYGTDLYTEEAVRVIQSHNSTGGPLFLYLAHLAPHAAGYETPLQAPAEDIAKFRYISDRNRRIYAAMVWNLDKSVGAVMEALDDAHLLNNSIVVFMSDNGAATRGLHPNHGSNWPLKGEKGTPWEGGVRTVAAIWSPLLKKQRRVSNQLMHISDWIPTLYHAAGGDMSELLDVDGFNLWDALSEDLPSPRSEILINIDDKLNRYAALRINELKYVTGTTLLGFLDDWVGELQHTNIPQYDLQVVKTSKAAVAMSHVNSYVNKNQFIINLRKQATISCDNSQYKLHCQPIVSPCVFNIIDDPCEQKNLYKKGFYNYFESKLANYRKTAKKPNNKLGEEIANPKYWNNTWTNWRDYANPKLVIVNKFFKT